MQAHAQRPLMAGFTIFITLIGCGAALVAAQDTPVIAVALAGLAASLGLVLLAPAAALALLVLTRFTFEMAWDQRVVGFGILELLAIGTPLAVLLVLMIHRPRFAHLPFVKPVILWSIVIAGIGAISALAHGNAMSVVQTTLRLTSGLPVFLLTVMVVRSFSHARRLLRLWALSAIPAVLVFYAYGDSSAMSYHGLLRLRALYHDVVTPAFVACVTIHLCLYFVGVERRRQDGDRSLWRIALLTGSIGLLGRMLFVTYHNALLIVCFLTAFVSSWAQRRFGLLLAGLLLAVGLSQIPTIQQRWWREIAIVQGDHDPIGFASGRPNRWRRFLGRWERAPMVTKVVGVYGAWGNPENQFLHLMIDLGPIGALATVGLLLSITLSLRRWIREETDPEKRSFFILILALLVGSIGAWITSTPLVFTNFQWFLWSIAGLAVVARQSQITTEPGTKERL